jgi:hypothetical protein
MRKLILLVTVLISQSSFCGEWNIKVDKKERKVSYKNESLVFSYPQTNVSPVVKEVKEIGGLQVVIFLARSSGTFMMFDEWHGAVFDKDNKLKGIYPYEYEVVTEATNRKINQPKWKVSGKVLTITEPELDETFKVDLP